MKSYGQLFRGRFVNLGIEVKAMALSERSTDDEIFAELRVAFAPERASLAARSPHSVRMRVLSALGRPDPLLKAARAMAGVVLVSAAGVAGCALAWLDLHGLAADSATTLRLSLSGILVVMALLVSLAAPSLARLDREVTGRCLGRRWQAGAGLELCAMRGVAFGFVLAAGLSLL